MKRIIILITACILFSACDKYLDIVPKDKFIPTSIEEYENMLNDETSLTSNDYFTELRTDNVFIPEAQPSGLWAKFSLPTRRIYQFEVNCYTENELDQMWSQAYKRLFTYNCIINDIMGTKGDEAKKKSVKAEALLFRAGENLNLVNLYAQHYDINTAATEPGIPLVLVADINAKHNRNTVKEVYDQIIADLTEAIPYLPDKSVIATKFRGCKAGGYALLARTYLFMGEYEKALDNANLAISSYGTLVDMNDYKIIIPGPFPYGPGNPLGWTDIPDAQYNQETIVARQYLRPFGLAMNVCASQELASLFDNNDKRWTLYYANVWPPAPPYNYYNNYGTKIFLRGDYYNNFLSTPEQYLIRAECNARLSNSQKAIDDINLLRKNRIAPDAYVAYTSADFTDADDILSMVLNERRRELAFLGMRHIDLKRLNKDSRFSKEIRHTIEGQEYVLPPNSPKWVRQLWPGSTKFNADWQLNPTE